MKKLLVTLAASCMVACGAPSAPPPLASAAPETAACTTSDIFVEVHGTRVEYDYAYVTGRIINNCREPTGVQLKVTLYDQQGQIITSHDPWPASISNIPAGSDFPFEDQTSVSRRPARADVRVINVKHW